MPKMKGHSLNGRKAILKPVNKETMASTTSVAIATATVFFHRFYAKHSFQEHDRFEVAMACLLLAGKTEESPKKLDVVIRECWKLRKRAAQQQAQRRA